MGPLPPLPPDFFAPRADGVTLLLLGCGGDASAGDEAWLSGAYAAPAGVINTRPAGWTQDALPPRESQPAAWLRYNDCWDAPPREWGSKVPADAWRAFLRATRASSDAEAEPLLRNLCGLRVYDVRLGALAAWGSMMHRLRQRCGPVAQALLFLLVLWVPGLLFSFFIFAIAIPSALAEALLWLAVRGAARACCGVALGAPIPGSGREQRDAEHMARRRALFQGFAQQHGLELSHGTVRHERWEYGDEDTAAGWTEATLHVLRLRLRAPTDPPGDAALV